jgi:hypothetical protein
MAEPFTYKTCPARFHCGSENSQVQLINLTGPNNSKATAYSCSMNVDVDGEPQAYGPPDKRPAPRDSLQDGGWLAPTKNAEKRAAYDEKFPAALQRLNDLTTQLHAKNPAPDHAAKVALEKEIHDLKKELHKLNPYYAEKPTPVNSGKVFWKWYGVYAMTEDEARRETHDDKIRGIPPRHPELHVQPELVDVYGKYPVVQSTFEPGPGYYVSPISAGFSAGSEQKFPKWDQRYYLPADAVSSNDPVQAPYGALSSGLTNVAGVHMRDQVFAINRDSGESLTFPFMDGAYGNKVGECSLSAFLKLGGKEVFLRRHGKKTTEIDRRHWDNSKFELLYLAFPRSQSPRQALKNFASASNADEFPILLSFLASTRGSGDAVSAFKGWQESKPALKPNPLHFDTIARALRTGGFGP